MEIRALLTPPNSMIWPPKLLRENSSMQTEPYDQKNTPTFLQYPQHYTIISLYHTWFKWITLQLCGHSCNLGRQGQPPPAPPCHWLAMAAEKIKRFPTRRPRNLSTLSGINHWIPFVFFVSPPLSLFLFYFVGIIIALSFRFAPGFTDNQELLPCKQTSSSIVYAGYSSFYLLKVSFFLLPRPIMITKISPFGGLGW